MQADSERRVIASNFSPHAGWAVRDVAQRNAAALAAHGDFFQNPQHQRRVNAVLQIVNQFFTVKRDVYVNHRTGQGRPFTVVKVSGAARPRMSAARVTESYRQPLQELEVEIVFSKATNSYLYRIY